jgi:hypothetical protein
LPGAGSLVGRILVATEATEGAIRTGCLGTADYRGKCSIDCGFLDVDGCKPCSFFGKWRLLPASSSHRSIKTLSGCSEPCYNQMRPPSSRNPDALLAYSHANYH